MGDDTVPSVVAAVDEVIWENWLDEDEADWIRMGKETWGIDHDTEFKVVVAEFSELALIAVFATPVLPGALTQATLSPPKDSVLPSPSGATKGTTT
jgi:hypothetical protein